MNSLYDFAVVVVSGLGSNKVQIELKIIYIYLNDIGDLSEYICALFKSDSLYRIDFLEYVCFNFIQRLLHNDLNRSR